jgi:hypothetical protein
MIFSLSTYLVILLRTLCFPTQLFTRSFTFYSAQNEACFKPSRVCESNNGTLQLAFIDGTCNTIWQAENMMG